MIQQHSSPTGYEGASLAALVDAYLAFEQRKRSQKGSSIVDTLPPPIPFSDVIQKLAATLDPELREPFWRAVAIRLRRYKPAALTSGLVWRVGREVLREFHAPSVT